MNRTLVVKALLLIFGVCPDAFAASLTGNPEADGWFHHGNSLSDGHYVHGVGNYAFETYTTQFTVTDGSIYDISGHDDPSYHNYYETNHWTKADARPWTPGDTVIGIGGAFNSITAEDASWDAFTGAAVNGAINGEHRFRLQAKVAGEDSTWSTSTIAPAGGNGIGSTAAGGAGSFLVRTSGWHDLATWESGEGTMWGLQKPEHIETTGIETTGDDIRLDADVARIIWTWDAANNRVGTWEILLNMSLIEADLQASGFNGALPGLLGAGVIQSVQVQNGASTDALASITVPEPSTWILALLGMVAIGGARCARRSRR